MIRKKQYFTLLEVLMAMVLVVVAFPLLIAPYFYSFKDIQENMEAMQVEKASRIAAANFFIDLHLGKIALSSVEENQEHPIPASWFQEAFPKTEFEGVYRMVRIEPRNPRSDSKVFLWQVIFSLYTQAQKNALAKRPKEIEALKKKNMFGFDFNIAIQEPPPSPAPNDQKANMKTAPHLHELRVPPGPPQAPKPPGGGK